MTRSILAATAIILTFAVGAPQITATEVSDFVRAVSAGRIAVISDGDFVSATYATGRLAPRERRVS